MPHATCPDGTAVWYDVRGHGPSTVLLVSGQSLDHTMWDGLWQRLAERRRVVLVDNRGTGRSQDLGPTRLTTDVLADDLAAVLDHVAGERVHYVGFSMGGRIGQAFAARHPQRLRSLSLVATGPGRGHEVPRPDAASQALLGGGTPAGRVALLHYFFTPEFAAAHPHLADAVLPSAPPQTVRAQFAASRRHDGWDALVGIGVPTLVLHGSDDELTPPGNAELLAGRVPGAQLVLLPGRHGVLHENPKALAALEAFLDEVDGVDGVDGVGSHGRWDDVTTGAADGGGAR